MKHNLKFDVRLGLGPDFSIDGGVPWIILGCGFGVLVSMWTLFWVLGLGLYVVEVWGGVGGVWGGLFTCGGLGGLEILIAKLN